MQNGDTLTITMCVYTVCIGFCHIMLTDNRLTDMPTYSLLMLSSCSFVQAPRSARVFVNKSCGHMPHIKYLQTCTKHFKTLYIESMAAKIQTVQ